MPLLIYIFCGFIILSIVYALASKKEIYEVTLNDKGLTFMAVMLFLFIWPVLGTAFLILGWFKFLDRFKKD